MKTAPFALLAVVALAMICKTSAQHLADCSQQNPVSGNALCDILCKIPICGKSSQGDVKWFSNSCYLNAYNVACATLYTPTDQTACPASSKPPQSNTFCPASFLR